VKKDNRVLSVADTDKAFYLAEGYDVVELDGKTNSYKVVKPATGGKTYSVAEYNALRSEKEALEAELNALRSEKDEPFDREAAKAKLKELGVEFSGNAKNETLKQLLDDHAKEDGK
jgi:hypothetical protein